MVDLVGNGESKRRRGHVRPIVDVLLQKAALALEAMLAAHESHGVDLEQQGCRTALVRGLGIEDVHAPERQVERLRPAGFLCNKNPRSVAGRCVVVSSSSISHVQC
jgi:hypothetical protein